MIFDVNLQTTNSNANEIKIQPTSFKALVCGG